METKMSKQQHTSLCDLSPVTTSENLADLEGASPREGQQQSSLPRKEAAHKKLLCPSAPANVGATLLGAIQIDGTVAFIKDNIAVTQEFLNMLDSTANGQAPETRFRFSAPCLSSKCKQWAKGGCSLPERLAMMIPHEQVDDEPLPSCSIRDRCRWFEQQGSSACRICPVVVTRGS